MQHHSLTSILSVIFLLKLPLSRQDQTKDQGQKIKQEHKLRLIKVESFILIFFSQRLSGKKITLLTLANTTTLSVSTDRLQRVFTQPDTKKLYASIDL